MVGERPGGDARRLALNRHRFADFASQGQASLAPVKPVSRCLRRVALEELFHPFGLG